MNFMAKNYKCILVISDLHLPYHKKDAFNFLRAIKKKYSDVLDFAKVGVLVKEILK